MSKNLNELVSGEALPDSKWITVDQSMIDQFADATRDHQWIHVDPKKCQAQSPFGTTIAHGLLSTSLMPSVFYGLIELDSTSQTLLNYGIDSLRFLEPVRVNDRIRYRNVLHSVEQKPTGSLYRFDCQVEIENREKPAMVGRFLMLLVQAD